MAEGALGSESVIPVGYEPLLQDVEPGDRMQLADGLIRCEVVDRTEAGLVAAVRVGGVLSDHKGVAFPDSKLSLEIVTPKDESDLAFGRELGPTMSRRRSFGAATTSGAWPSWPAMRP